MSSMHLGQLLLLLLPAPCSCFCPCSLALFSLFAPGDCNLGCLPGDAHFEHTKVTVHFGLPILRVAGVDALHIQPTPIADLRHENQQPRRHVVPSSGSDYLCQETFYVLLPALMAVVAVGFGPCKTQVGGGLKI